MICEKFKTQPNSIIFIFFENRLDCKIIGKNYRVDFNEICYLFYYTLKFSLPKYEGPQRNLRGRKNL